MTIAFMSLFTALMADRIGTRAGKFLFAPLLLIGLGSVIYWRVTGDLRLYGLVQFLPILLALLTCALFPARDGLRGRHLGGMLILYGAAKVLERADVKIWEVAHHLISGHSLKHLFAAPACAVVAWFVGCPADDAEESPQG